MNRKELINKIAKASNLKKGEVKRLLSALSETIAESLAKGEKVSLTGFGTFVISERKGSIRPSATARLRTSQKLKDEIR